MLLADLILRKGNLHQTIALNNLPLRQVALGQACESPRASPYPGAEPDEKTVPYFVPRLFQNAAERLTTRSNRRARRIANKHAGLSHVSQRVIIPHCLSLEGFLATVNCLPYTVCWFCAAAPHFGV